jgi:CheY-like chemotaxis protein
MQNRRPYILLVEDSKIAGVVATGVLTELGCLVDLAEGETDALHLVETQYYDMIFMDLGLIDTTGVLVTEKIKQIDHAKTIPVVALTAHNDDHLKEECFRVGMVGFIKKPLEMEKAQYFLKKYALI